MLVRNYNEYRRCQQAWPGLVSDLGFPQSWALHLGSVSRAGSSYIKHRSLCDKSDYFVLALFQAETKRVLRLSR